MFCRLADFSMFCALCLGVSNLIPSKTLPLANSTSPASAHSATQRLGVPAAPVTVTRGAPRTSSTASPLSMATSTDRACTGQKKGQNRYGMLPKMNKGWLHCDNNMLQLEYIPIYYNTPKMLRLTVKIVKYCWLPCPKISAWSVLEPTLRSPTR